MNVEAEIREGLFRLLQPISARQFLTSRRRHCILTTSQLQPLCSTTAQLKILNLPKWLPEFHSNEIPSIVQFQRLTEHFLGSTKRPKSIPLPSQTLSLPSKSSVFLQLPYSVPHSLSVPDADPTTMITCNARPIAPGRESWNV